MTATLLAAQHALRMLLARRSSLIINVLLIALSVATMTTILLVSRQIEQGFERDLRGVDAIVGAKGSPLQMILSGILHVDVPAGNIPFQVAQELKADPRVKQLIPISIGDSHEGYRIVGTEPALLDLYQAKLKAGGLLWGEPMQAVAGYRAAATLPIGAVFSGVHSLAGGGEVHGQTPYTVTGHLQRCSCVLDRLILTSTDSVWRVHEDAVAMDETDKKALQEEREITFALIEYASPLAAVSFPRYVNQSTQLQAAAPAVEITRLLRAVGIGEHLLHAFAAVLLAVAGLSLWVSMTQALRDRCTDLAMLRMLGASASRVSALLLIETALLALAAWVLGAIAGHLLTSVLGYLLAQERSLAVSGWVWLVEELWLLGGVLVLSMMSVVWPLRQVYRQDVLKQLQMR